VARPDRADTRNRLTEGYTAAMRLFRFWRRDSREAGERFRAQHSAFLTRAVQTPQAYPRIPVKAVDHGGYDRLRRVPTGPAHAALWWSTALDRVGET